MHPTRLNIAPKHKKAYLAKILYVQFLKFSIEILLIFVAIFGMALLGAQSILQNYFFEATASTAIISPSHTIKQKCNCKEINDTLANLEQIQDGYMPWTNFMQKFSDKITPNISLSLIDIKKNDQKLILSGQAKTREDLLRLKNSLEELDYIDTIQVPLEQLTKPEEVPFVFNIPISI